MARFLFACTHPDPSHVARARVDRGGVSRGGGDPHMETRADRPSHTTRNSQESAHGTARKCATRHSRHTCLHVPTRAGVPHRCCCLLVSSPVPSGPVCVRGDGSVPHGTPACTPARSMPHAQAPSTSQSYVTAGGPRGGAPRTDPASRATVVYLSPVHVQPDSRLRVEAPTKPRPALAKTVE